ncbi:hypothetical protein EVAR_32325_1 [Eumeta japonica]|uniref:Uncharacterized protein n=1 Tax=Eumeta variegata TaxID=151549 RepID=A0A4C1ZCN8_EUMVA|nr:hypothetical protein EVAR_32325_1 [Eumeta japonica]
MPPIRVTDNCTCCPTSPIPEKIKKLGAETSACIASRASRPRAKALQEKQSVAEDSEAEAITGALPDCRAALIASPVLVRANAHSPLNHASRRECPARVHGMRAPRPAPRAPAAPMTRKRRRRLTFTRVRGHGPPGRPPCVGAETRL